MMLKKKSKNLILIKKNILFEIRPHRNYPKRTEILESQYQTYRYYDQCTKLLGKLRGTSIEKNFIVKLYPKVTHLKKKKCLKM